MSEFNRELRSLTDARDFRGLLELGTAVPARWPRSAYMCQYRTQSAIIGLGDEHVERMIEMLGDEALCGQAARVLARRGPPVILDLSEMLRDPSTDKSAVGVALWILGETAFSTWLLLEKDAPGEVERIWRELERIGEESPWALVRHQANVLRKSLAEALPRGAPDGTHPLALNRAVWASDPEGNRTDRCPRPERQTEADRLRIAEDPGIVAVPVANGDVAIVDAVDIDLVGPFEWTRSQRSERSAAYAIGTRFADGRELAVCLHCESPFEVLKSRRSRPDYCDVCAREIGRAREPRRRRVPRNSPWYLGVVPTYDLLMHRLIARCQGSMVVHHWNGDGLDNRRCNLVSLEPSEHRELHEAGWRGELESPRGRPTPLGVQRNGLPSPATKEPEKTGCMGCCLGVVACALGVLTVVAVVASRLA